MNFRPSSFDSVAYFRTMACVGAVRKAAQVHDATFRTKRGVDRVEKPFLAFDKACIVLVGAGIYSLYAPLYLVKDVRSLELAARGIDRDEDWLCRRPKGAVELLFA
jgi:hypothetical protein